MVDHAALGNSELHEPKGVASASDGTVYTADGLGSGSWEPILAEESITRTFSGTTREITGLGDYAAVILTFPNLVNNDNNNEWFTFQVGNSGGYTTSSVYYTHEWNSGAQTRYSGTVGYLQYSYTSGPSPDQTFRLLFTNWNKEYYTVGSMVGHCIATPRQMTYFIREQKAYDRFKLYCPSNIANGIILAQGFKG